MIMLSKQRTYRKLIILHQFYFLTVTSHRYSLAFILNIIYEGIIISYTNNVKYLKVVVKKTRSESAYIKRD